MGVQIEIRGQSPETAREYVRSELSGLDDGVTVSLLADHDPAVAREQYRITGDAALEWEYEEEGPERWQLEVRKADRSDASERPAFDVRDLPPRERHSVLLETFGLMDADEGFVLVNDHDPKPLYHELRSMYGDVVEWEYASRGGDEWKVAIGRIDAGTGPASDVAASFDVRDIPKQERHPTIHHRYGNLDAGDAVEIVAPHEPIPLKDEFERRYDDAFAWDVVERSAGECRVRVTKGATDANADGSEADSTRRSLEVTGELDVRALPPAERHSLIFEEYEDLETGEAFVLVNDHDPKPLYHQFEAEAGPGFRWEYRKEEPGEFRVRIGKADAAEPDAGASRRSGAPF